MQPVYDYLGYKLIEAKYENKGLIDNSYLSISLINENLTKDNVYVLTIKVATDYDGKEDYFIFENAFSINDKDWFESIDSNTKKVNFFSIAFPFIREKIFSITSDINPGLFIPVLDVRQFDLSKEIKFVKN